MAGPSFIRVKDPKTGHEFDRREDDPAVVSGRFVPVKGEQYPPSPLTRRAKHHIELAGRTATRETTSRRAPSVAPAKKEKSNGHS